jgi:N-terminal acetyltransferase B complex non-catalytic subunit
MLQKGILYVKPPPNTASFALTSLKQAALKWVAVNINALKFEYFLCISKAPLPEKESLENFVSDCLRMYKLALGINNECGDEACILAVVGLVKLHHFSRDYDLDDGNPASIKPDKASPQHAFSPKSYLVQALSLLEVLRSNHYHNYSAALLLTLLYQMLGLTALAATAFDSLSVKEIQHDTIGHVFWSRISMHHPFPCKSGLTNRASQKPSSNNTTNHSMNHYINPIAGLDAVLYWYDAASDRTVQHMARMLDDVPFDKILEFSEFKQNVENSFSRAIFVLESRRIGRIINRGTTPDILPSTFVHWVRDNRDFASIPDFEYPTTDKFYTFVAPRPTPMVRIHSPNPRELTCTDVAQRYWLARHTINDIIVSLPSLKAPPPPYLLALLSTNVAYLTDNSSDASYQLTSSEQSMAVGWTMLQGIICYLILGPENKWASKSIGKEIDQLFIWTLNLKSLPEVPPLGLLPQADIIQDLYLRLEMLQAVFNVAQFASTVVKTKKLPQGAKDTLPKILSIAIDAGKLINSAAAKWKEHLKRENVALVNKLMSSTATGDDVAEILELSHEATIIDARAILEAAIDTVEGLESVKVG